MNLVKKLLRIFLINQVSIWVANGVCKDDPPPVTDAKMTVILKNETVVYTCTNNKEFSSGDAVIVSDCTSDGWYPVTAVCSASNLDVSPCSGTPDPEPKDATYDAATGTVLYRPYKCNGEMAWLSGRSVKVMPCRKGDWLTIYDICDEGCPVPRDCADVADLGLEEEGEYLVIPTGKMDGKIYSVHCLLNNTEENGGGNWTYIFRQGINDTKKIADEYKAGYGNESKLMGNYFVGLDFLAAISQNFSDRQIGQVMDILFYSQSNELLYYSSYGNFTVGTVDDNYKLWSVGKYHGTAGDSMCPIVPTPFEFGTATDQTYRWWGVTPSTWPSVEGMHGNFLTYSMKWERLSSKMSELNYVEIRIRPINIDRAKKCPPMVGSDVSWVETEATIPYSRSIGTNITWKCIGDMYYEGEEGKDRTKEGISECIDGPNGPQWTKNITLPCRVKCPDNFVLLEDGLRCFNYSQTEAKGFIAATLQCQKLNSTLAIMKNKTDLQKAGDSKKYIVNHAQRGTSQTELLFSFPEDIYNCSGGDKICMNDPSNECVLVDKSLGFEYKSCGASFPFICEVPTNCPDGYKLYGFTCFIVKLGSTFDDGNRVCAQDGASLAYPPNNTVAKEMESKLSQDFSITNPESQYFMGVNYWKDSWNKGDFTMDPNYESRLDKGSANKWKVLSIKKGNANSSTQDGVEAKYISVDLAYTSDVAVYALCQYPGPIDCMEAPPDATANMTLHYTDTDFGVGREAIYQCDEGFFVAKNKSVSNQTLVCYGMLAEWYPALLPCERTPVCDTMPTVISDQIKNTTNNESAYIGGNITYSCPADMSFAGRQQNLTVICNKTTDGFAYNIMDIPECDYCTTAVEPVNMTSTWSSSQDYGDGDSVNVSCWKGYQYLTGATKQKVSCTSWGWVFETTEPCYKMCSGNVSLKNATSTWESGYIFIGSPGEMMCDEGFQFMNGAEKMNITCTSTGWNLTNFEGCFPQCTGPAEKGNAFSTWNGTEYYDLGTIETMECKDSYEYAYGQTTQNVTCAKGGWDLSKLQACYAVCENDPPTPGKNVKPFNVTSRVVGSTISYQCETGYFPPIMANTKPSPNITIRCNESAEWTNPLGTKPYNCTELCLDDPPATPTNGTSDWDKMNHGKDAKVTYECEDGYFFGNFSTTWIVTCDGMSWGPMDPTNFVCSRFCDEDPPKPQTNENYDFNTSYGKVGQNVEYKCKNFTANKDGNKAYKITCLDSGSWTSRPDGFLCEKGCGGPPISPPTGASWNYSGDFREGVIVQYNCTTDFMQVYAQFIYSNCTESAWSLAEVPACQSDTTPSGPNVNNPDETAPYQSHYKLTADYIYSDIARDFVSTSGAGKVQSTTGPFGFGNAVNIDNTTAPCIKKENFAQETDKCLINPSFCDDTGFSVSFWVNTSTHSNYLEPIDNNDDPKKYQYAMSTGGDAAGHPGFAIAFQKHWLIAIVSSGPEYWKTRVLGQINASVWNNIGFVYNATNDLLKLYVNLKLVATANGKESGSDKLLGLYPPELIIGCHKDNDNKVYRGHLNGMFDEVAVWKRPLKDLPDDFEIIKFFGGLDQNKTFQTKEALQKMLQNIDFQDTKQIKIATETIEDFFKKAEPTQATPTAGTTVPQNASYVDNLNNTLNPESIDYLKTLVDIIRILTNLDKYAPVISPSDLEQYIVLSNLVGLAFSKEKKEVWGALQEQNSGNNTYDAMDLMNTYTVFQMEMAKRTDFPNGTQPFCYQTSQNDDFFGVTCKLSLVDFINGYTRYILPNYNDPKTSNFFSTWDDPFDKVKYFTGLYLDDRCHDRGVSATGNLFDALSQFASIRMMKFKPDKEFFKTDSRIIDMNVEVDPARLPNGRVDTSKPLCKFDPDLIARNRMQVILEHISKMAPVNRQLLFHENENYTNILIRRCVRWQQDYSEAGTNLTGAWNTSSCKIIETSFLSTMCYCNDFGKYVIIAEETEKVEVDDDPSWLLIAKFGLYGASALAVTIYIIVVILSGELKDQLHLMGMNLALALLLGSVVMVISEFEPVRIDRHMCFGIGTLIHFFYSAVGVWMFCLGHASFKAITAGIIDGRFRAYMLISWGTPICLTGIPYIMYLHDLGYDPRCFIGWYNKVKYIFFGPQVGCAVLSTFWAIVILTNISTHALRKRHLFKDYGSFCRGAALLLIYLSVTWGIGFVAYIRFGFKNPNFYPPFQIMNALSGVILLICIGFMSNRFRKFVCCQTREKFYDDDEDYDKRNLVQDDKINDEYPTIMR